MQVGSLVQEILVSLQLARPGTVVGNSDPAVSQMLSALASAADELVQRHPYTRLLVDGKWVQPAIGPATDAVTLDTDEILFDTSTIRAATKWRWQEWNGLDYAEAFRQTEDSISRAAARHLRATRSEVVY
ncbi:hypothetical protein FPY71_11580 [Aureimonas fodinaquatilis]|uniref:Uncharacterized protein n=1 Tax=Aureimonas fodinaquatilis TaxID=2565783 RepID=A0A5B0E0U0_9HYPH|nr:hypothetical protein [Aureimonas fodinaquatilis]KAA0971079.1 hypothetical protein FPY71_11580 [Aureimonas fodinaquatilis]